MQNLNSGIDSARFSWQWNHSVASDACGYGRGEPSFARVLRDLVDAVYPDAERSVLVLDNPSIHHPACLYGRFEPAEARRIAAKIEWHHTPEHGSWLNVAECGWSVLQRQCLKGRMPAIEAVERCQHGKRAAIKPRLEWTGVSRQTMRVSS